MNTLSQFARFLRAMPHLPGRVTALRAIGRIFRKPWVEFAFGGFQFRFDLRDPYQAAMALDAYEKDTTSILSRVLGPGDVYVDVGAQFGYTAAHAASAVGKSGKLILYEPDPEVFKRLKTHLPDPVKHPANPDAPTILIRNEACSDRKGELPLRLAPILGQSTFMDLKMEEKGRGIKTVPVTTLDDSLESLNVPHVRLMKMDIEGHELFALRGLRRYFLEGRIDFLLIEKALFQFQYQGFEPEHLHGYLAHFGYVGFHENGTRITSQSLNRKKWENLLYARSAELSSRIFPGPCSVPVGEPFAEEEITAHYLDIADDARFEGRQIITLVQRGELEIAIPKARAFLDRYPDANWFRGHFAHWLNGMGRREEAIREYELMVQADPRNEEAVKVLSRLLGN